MPLIDNNLWVGFAKKEDFGLKINLVINFNDLKNKLLQGYQVIGIDIMQLYVAN